MASTGWSLAQWWLRLMLIGFFGAVGWGAYRVIRKFARRVFLLEFYEQ